MEGHYDRAFYVLYFLHCVNWHNILKKLIFLAALVQEDSTCLRATKPMHHNYWACALEAMSHNHQSPRAHAPQEEKPP